MQAKRVVDRLPGMIPFERAFMKLTTVDLNSETDARPEEYRASSLRSERNHEVDPVALPREAENRHLAPRLVAESPEDVNGSGFGVALGRRFVAAKGDKIPDELRAWHLRSKRLQLVQRNEPGSKRVFERVLHSVPSTDATDDRVKFGAMTQVRQNKGYRGNRSFGDGHRGKRRPGPNDSWCSRRGVRMQPHRRPHMVAEAVQAQKRSCRWARQ